MKRWIDRHPEIRRLKKWEAAWLAGVIDGEGSIGLYDFGKEGRRVQIQMANSDPKFVALMRKMIGCGSSVMRTNTHLTHKGKKPIYQYSLKGSQRCYWVLKQIIPFLVIKRGKALAIIKELEEKPFGRWVNATPEYRKLQSDRVKAEWRDPVKRMKRLKGIRRYFRERLFSKI